jgi:hypothetical protein
MVSQFNIFGEALNQLDEKGDIDRRKLAHSISVLFLDCVVSFIYIQWICKFQRNFPAWSSVKEIG